MRRSTYLAAGAALLGMGISASAADMYNRGSMKDAPVYLPVTTWTGFYIGGHVGGLIDDGSDKWDILKEKKGGEIEEYAVKAPKPYKDSFTNAFGKDDSVIGGVHAGFNVQNGVLVYGLEGDISFADHIDYLASVRGRLGLTNGDWLLYATGGVAFLSLDDRHTLSATDGAYKGKVWNFSDNQDQTGFVVGGGLEKKISPNWSIGVEGLYYSFDDDHQKYLIGTNRNEDTYVSYDRSLDFWEIRGRLTYHVVQNYEPLK